MRAQDADRLARWIADNQPRLFAQLLTRSGLPKEELAGIFDSLSTFGTSVGNAVSSVGSYLTSQDGLNSIAKLGTTYLQTQAQRDALQTQLRLAQSGQPLAPIYTATPYTTAIANGVYYQPNPTVPAQPFNASLVSAPEAQIGGIPVKWIAIGGVALLVLVFVIKSSR
jgi:hypothetical protein